MEELRHSHAEPILFFAQVSRLYGTHTRRYLSFVLQLKPIFHKLFNLSYYNTVRHIPIVFVDGEPEKVIKVKQKVPDAIYTTEDKFKSIVKQFL